MNITFVSTAPSLTIGSLTWSSIGASVTVNTADLKAYERANIEYEYSIGNLISTPKLLNGSISATEDNVSPTALGGDVRAAVGAGGSVTLSAPGLSSIPMGISVKVEGTPGVGNVLTATPSAGWSASSWQWYRNGVAISWATQQTYTQSIADIGATLTVAGSGWSYTAPSGVTTTGTVPFSSFSTMGKPLGYSGALRTVTAGHNSVSMYRAQADVTAQDVEVKFTNAVVYGSATTSEVFPADAADLQVDAHLLVQNDTTTSVSFTAAVASGATSATLTANATSSQRLLVKFSNGEFRWVSYTSGSAAVTWVPALTSGANATGNVSYTFTRTAQITFDGSNTGVLTGGRISIIRGIAAGQTIAKGKVYYVTSFIRKADGTSFSLPGNYSANHQDVLGLGLQETFYDNATNYTTTRFGLAPFYAVAGGSSMFRPLSVKVAGPANTNYLPVTVIGDSIASKDLSWVQVWLSRTGIPFVNLAKAGETGSVFIANSTARREAFDKGGVALVEMGRNAWTLAGAQALWSHLRAQGFSKIIQVLITPQTTSATNDWSSETTQNQDTTTSAVNAQVAALVGKPNGPDGVIDTYTPVQGTDPLKWAAGYTADGTHPTDATALLIANYCDVQNYQNLFLR